MKYVVKKGTLRFGAKGKDAENKDVVEHQALVEGTVIEDGEKTLGAREVKRCLDLGVIEEYQPPTVYAGRPGTGRGFFDPDLLKGKSLQELRQAIREKDPTVDVNTIMSLGDAIAFLSGGHRTTASARKWTLDPATLKGRTLASLRQTVDEMDHTVDVNKLTTVDEAIAFLSREREGSPTTTTKKWTVDPATLTGLDLSALRAMIHGRDSTVDVQKITSPAEAIAFLSRDRAS